MREWRQWIVSVCVWSALGGLMLRTGFARPEAVGIVWFVGFVWITGYITAGPKDADHLVKVWAGMLAGLALIAGLGAAALS